MKAWHITLTTVTALLFSVTMNGCTLIGWGVGTAVDGSIPKQRILQPSQASEIHWSRYIEIIGTGGQVYTGKFNGLDRVSPEEYSHAYQCALDHLDTLVTLPLPGDMLRFRMTDAELLSGCFVSADAYSIRVLETVSQRERDLQFDAIQETSGNQGFIDTKLLRTMIAERKLPQSTALVILREETRSLIPVDSIRQVQEASKSHGARIGLALGAIIDAAVVTAIVQIQDARDRGYDNGYDDGRRDWDHDHPGGR